METQEFINSEITHSFFIVFFFVDLKILRNMRNLSKKNPTGLVYFTEIMLLFTVLTLKVLEYF